MTTHQHATGLYPLTTRERRTIQQFMLQGLNILRRTSPAISIYEAPRTIVEQIKEEVDYYREYPEHAHMEHINALGWLWAEQVSRSYGWKWLAWDTGRARHCAIVHYNREYVSFPPNVVRYACTTLHEPNRIDTFFDDLGMLREITDFEDALLRGWLAMSEGLLKSV